MHGSCLTPRHEASPGDAPGIDKTAIRPRLIVLPMYPDHTAASSDQAPSTQPKWLALTGQGRKVATFQAVASAGCLLMLLSFIVTPLGFPEGFRPYLAATGCALTFGGLFYLLTTVTCPRCNSRVAAYLIAKSSFHSWLSAWRARHHAPAAGTLRSRKYRRAAPVQMRSANKALQRTAFGIRCPAEGEPGRLRADTLARCR